VARIGICSVVLWARLNRLPYNFRDERRGSSAATNWHRPRYSPSRARRAAAARGIDIPHDRKAVGHSDADVLLHAIIDAMLGAAALGDIGEMYPNTDEANRDRDSAEMLRGAYERFAAAGFAIVNMDCIVFAEQPKLFPYKDAIRQRIAELLEIPANSVGLKAKTGEGVDAIGRQEAISAQCVLLAISSPTEIIDYA